MIIHDKPTFKCYSKSKDQGNPPQLNVTNDKDLVSNVDRCFDIQFYYKSKLYANRSGGLKLIFFIFVCHIHLVECKMLLLLHDIVKRTIIFHTNSTN